MAYVYIVTQHFRKQSNGQEELKGDGEKKRKRTCANTLDIPTTKTVADHVPH